MECHVDVGGDLEKVIIFMLFQVVDVVVAFFQCNIRRCCQLRRNINDHGMKKNDKVVRMENR